MTMSDPIADMLTRIRNACRGGHPQVSMPSSKLKEDLAEVLSDTGYVDSCSVSADADGGVGRTLTIVLKYTDEGTVSVIEKIQRVSKPSCRVYVGSKEIPRVLGGLGIAVLSTSSGLMSDRVARKKNVGGEVLCYVW